MLQRVHKYGALNTHDLLKVAALLIMTIDHVGAYLMPDELWLRAVGRIMTPAWFFLIGFAHGKRGTAALLVGAILVTLANDAAYYPLFPLNVLVSIVVCRGMLLVAERFRLLEKRPIETFVVLFVLNIPLMIFWEYGMLAVMFAYGGRMVREGLKQWQHTAFWVLSTVAYLIWQASTFGFDHAQMVLVSIGTMLCCYSLYYYRQRVISVRLPVAIDYMAKLISRYSLQYYVLHRAAFQLIGTYVLMNREQVGALFY